VVCAPGCVTAQATGGSGSWPWWRTEQPEAEQCGEGAAVDGGARLRAAGAEDQASAAGFRDYSVDPPKRLRRHNGSEPATCKRSAS